MKVQIGIFECTGIMGQDLVLPYIQSTTVLCDYGDDYTVVLFPTHMEYNLSAYDIISTIDRRPQPLHLPCIFRPGLSGVCISIDWECG